MKNEDIQGQDHARGGGGHLLHLDTGSYCISLNKQKTRTISSELLLQSDTGLVEADKKENANVLNKAMTVIWFECSEMEAYSCFYTKAGRVMLAKIPQKYLKPLQEL